MINIPDVSVGIVAVSRDCFPIDLSIQRRKAIVQLCNKKNTQIIEIQTTVENEQDVMKALDELREKEVDALVVYLGNFGPEGPETMLAQEFDGPAIFCAAAEENIEVLSSRRGDAYCGMLNASYNLKLRGVDAYIPEKPVGTAAHIADLTEEFEPIARAIIGVRNLKIITFGPRPYDFLACNAPIAPLFKMGINVQENSELDLFAAYNDHKDDPRISNCGGLIWNRNSERATACPAYCRNWHSMRLRCSTGSPRIRGLPNTSHWPTNAGLLFRSSSGLCRATSIPD